MFNFNHGTYFETNRNLNLVLKIQMIVTRQKLQTILNSLNDNWKLEFELLNYTTFFETFWFHKFSQRGFRSSVFYGSGAVFGSYWYELWFLLNLKVAKIYWPHYKTQNFPNSFSKFDDFSNWSADTLWKIAKLLIKKNLCVSRSQLFWHFFG